MREPVPQLELRDSYLETSAVKRWEDDLVDGANHLLSAHHPPPRPPKLYRADPLTRFRNSPAGPTGPGDSRVVSQSIPCPSIVHLSSSTFHRYHVDGKVVEA